MSVSFAPARMRRACSCHRVLDVMKPPDREFVRIDERMRLHEDGVGRRSGLRAPILRLNQ